MAEKRLCGYLSPSASEGFLLLTRASQVPDAKFSRFCSEILLNTYHPIDGGKALWHMLLGIQERALAQFSSKPVNLGAVRSITEVGGRLGKGEIILLTAEWSGGFGAVGIWLFSMPILSFVILS